MKRFAALTCALLFTLLLLTGCQSGEQQQVVNVYNWGEYIDESIFDDFEAETGIKVNYNTFASNEMLYYRKSRKNVVCKNQSCGYKREEEMTVIE